MNDVEKFSDINPVYGWRVPADWGKKKRVAFALAVRMLREMAEEGIHNFASAKEFLLRRMPSSKNYIPFILGIGCTFGEDTFRGINTYSYLEIVNGEESVRLCLYSDRIEAIQIGHRLALAIACNRNLDNWKDATTASVGEPFIQPYLDDFISIK